MVFARLSGLVQVSPVAPGRVRRRAQNRGFRSVMDLRVQVKPPYRVLTLSIAGELDALSADDLIDAAAAFQAGRFPQVVLDVAGIVFCDGAGLAAILAIWQQVTSAGGHLHLRRPCNQMGWLLRASECQDLLPAEPAKPDLGLIHNPGPSPTH
jgi:anti-sigma B factor antagonist